MDDASRNMTKLQESPDVSVVENGPPSPELEKPSEGIILIPQPSSDPRDPLNWPFRKKVFTIAILSLAMFAGYAAPFCGQLNLTQQAALYSKTVVQITYFVSIFPSQVFLVHLELIIYNHRTLQLQLVLQLEGSSGHR